MHWANQQIHKSRNRVNGKWIYVLDDDDYITDLSFIEELKKLDEKIDASIVIVKGYIEEKLYPSINWWKRTPIRGTIGSPNFIVKKETFKKYSNKWNTKKAGDYFFINAAYEFEKVYWWNRIVFHASIGNGMPEFNINVQEQFIKIQEEYDRYQNPIHA